MKKIIFGSLCILLNYFPAISQEIINKPVQHFNLAIQQINIPGLDNFMNLQTLNQNINNSVSTSQIGDENSVNINQQKDNGTAIGNKLDVYQSGNSNEFNLHQSGSGNILLGVQSGSITDIENSFARKNLIIEKKNTIALPAYSLTPNLMEGNSLNIEQNGSKNGIIAIQDGTNNTFSAKQSGSNNYLYTLQKGVNNSIIDYKQDNESDNILYDKIIQVGDNLSLRIDNSLNSRKTGDIFIQTGTNLSFELNNIQRTSCGGVEVNMTGNNMKVKVDQTYFSVH